MSKNYEPRLKTKYAKEIRGKLQEQFNYSNEMQVPKLDKVVINMGVGEAVADSKKIKSALAELEKIAGQTPVPTKARVSMKSAKTCATCRPARSTRLVICGVSSLHAAQKQPASLPSR